MRRICRPLLHALLPLTLLLAVGCSSVASLDTRGPDFTDAERSSVRGQVDKALAEGRYNVAWNQEVTAGGDRDRLEQIALAAQEARSGHAPGMFEALRERHGALQAEARRTVSARAEAAQRAGLWMRAVQIELTTADDPPAYTQAWAVYRAAPPDQAPEVLKAITDAKQAATESDE